MAATLQSAKWKAKKSPACFWFVYMTLLCSKLLMTSSIHDFKSTVPLSGSSCSIKKKSPNCLSSMKLVNKLLRYNILLT